MKPTKHTRDFCTREGALRLQSMIEAYWAEQGHDDVIVSLKAAGFVPNMRSVRTDVRSNMINGRPNKKIDAAPFIESRGTMGVLSPAWTPEEDKVLIEANSQGLNFVRIALLLDGRSQRACSERFLRIKKSQKVEKL